MIISGLQTGNTRWLAAHLQNAADNETIDVVEVTGTIARDIDGALAEFDAYTQGTRAREGVYAAFINPPEPLTRQQYAQALALMEKRLGLAGQPRVVVFHIKKGREHCHVVWSRIDTKRMKAIHLSHDKQKLRRCAQELATEFGLPLPEGLARDRGKDRFDDKSQPTRAEKAMEAASGLSRGERRAQITACYRTSDTAHAFQNALEAAGFVLACGDKRAFVVVDKAGHVHSLARQIYGAKTKDVKRKLEGLKLSSLPSVDQAKVLVAQRVVANKDAARCHKQRQDIAEKKRQRLSDIQRKRHLELDTLWQIMKTRQMHEWKVLLAHLKAEKDQKVKCRIQYAIGLARYIKKIAVIRQLLAFYAKRRKRALEDYDRLLKQSLQRRHDNEAAELQRRYAALDRLEQRETLCFNQAFGDQADKADKRQIKTQTYRFSYDLATQDITFGYIEDVDVSHPIIETMLATMRVNVDRITISSSHALVNVAVCSSPAVTAQSNATGIFQANFSDITQPTFTKQDTYRFAVCQTPSFQSL